jgi:hypothetical protein
VYAFNAIQIVALIVALPWIIRWCADHDHGFGWCLSAFALAMGFVFLVVSVTRSLYELDSVLREH